jgi:acetyl-CoA carboxylase biotin carboxyl carrier protein
LPHSSLDRATNFRHFRRSKFAAFSPTTNTTVELDQIRKIVELMQEHELSYFDMTTADGVHLRLKKGADLEALRGALSSASFAPVAAAPAVASPPTTAAPTAAAAPSGAEITSPMVGTFYRKAAPDAPEFVKVGDAVSVGQTLCIIEAMKVMNEIKAEKSGTITAVVAEDATPVQFGDVLFRIA